MWCHFGKNLYLCIFIAIALWLYVSREIFGRIYLPSTPYILWYLNILLFQSKKFLTIPRAHVNKFKFTLLGRACEAVEGLYVLCTWGALKYMLCFLHILFPLKSVPLLFKEGKSQKWGGADQEPCNCFWELLLTGPKPQTTLVVLQWFAVPSWASRWCMVHW